MKGKRITNVLKASLPVGLILFSLAVGVYHGSSSALVGSDFNPAHIIDDVVFTNNHSMTSADIQNFLYAKTPVCDTYGTTTKSYYYNSTTGQVNNDGSWVTTTRLVYGQRYASWYNAHPFTGYVTNDSVGPFVCLRDYVENPSSGVNNLQNPTALIPGGESAAQIIYNAAQAYQINPQVLLTILQKEQGLVTDTWPWLDEYKYATGFNCTDTGGCNGYAGFFQQVDTGAKQLRNYLNNPTSFNYLVGSNKIYYNVLSACSSYSMVNIQNQATAALYDYTPYQPNSNVLNNTNPTGSASGPGGAVYNDSCASYGNRNFWWYFNSWFGSSLASAYSWSPVSQTVFTDSSMTTTGSSTMVVGERRYLQIVVKNTGSATWYRGTLKLGTSNPGDRLSNFYDGSWMDKNRPATLVESSVAPGGTGTFDFWITAGQQTGDFKEYFNLLEEGVTWLNDNGLYFPLKAVPQQYTWSVSSQQSYYDAAHTIPTAWNAQTVKGQKVYAHVSVVNTGNVTWYNNGNNPVLLGTAGPGNRNSTFCDPTWYGCNRAALLNEASVAPGGTGTFDFVFTPSQTGGYKEYFDLVAEGKTWMKDVGMYYPITVGSPAYTWSPVNQATYSDVGLTSQLPYSLTMSNGSSDYAVITAKNTGNVAWDQSIHVATTHPGDRSSTFYDASWLAQNRPAQPTQTITYPGQTATFVFKLDASQVGTYKEYFSLVAEGKTWMNDVGLYYPITVQ